MSIKLGNFDLGAEIEVEDDDLTLGGLVGTGFGSPILLKGSKSVKYLTGEGRYDFSEEIVERTEGVLRLSITVQVEEFEEML